ncbi:L,D-transpeptidase catalytic domain [Planctomycetes bacterium CA13]|uniref:L,D-transpeptidase catalytic domain n=1 Tax=Novipirellula herctigrandis TaxID=2527986 RepID=A0A5C5YWV4_9BACT|nr:L,D-transpeptidase catalytic domain [Planctomycetes bacterium CA13]
MQTIKTAAIVVLLMTVMYGAYVSLTTPPDTLPPEVAELVMDGSGFDIEHGLPESLGGLEINTGVPESGSGASGFAVSSGVPEGQALPPGQGTFARIDSAGTPAGTFASPYSPAGEVGSEAIADANSYALTGGVSAQLSDSDERSDLTIHQPDDNDIPNHNTTIASLASASTHKATSPKGAPTQYPSTNMSFELPEPNQASSGQAFDPSAASATSVTASVSDDASSIQNQVNIESAADLSAASSSHTNIGLANAFKAADAQYASDQRKEALATLSLFYNTPNLSPAEREELLGRLDPLAAEVIYSKRHLLEQAYRIGHHETLMQIAVRYEVPWQLLANINGIQDPITVLPGTELKVVRGPFRAEVDLTRLELTLFVGELYAGRFPIAVGNDPAPQPGTFTIQDKQSERTYYDANGTAAPPNSPNNPYGTLWLDLGRQLCIHGSPYATKPSPQGCISVAADYADDLYGILTQGSSVTIRR